MQRGYGALLYVKKYDKILKKKLAIKIKKQDPSCPDIEITLRYANEDDKVKRILSFLRSVKIYPILEVSFDISIASEIHRIKSV